MIVSPIDSRYGREEVKRIFDIQNRFNLMLKVEIETMKAQMEEKIIPNIKIDDMERILEGGVNIKRIGEIEKETHHDIMAFIRTVSEQSGNNTPFLHFGLTSNDLIDTSMALQLKDFYDILLKDIYEIQETLIEKVQMYARTPMLGRTHGQHASPITFGLKLASWLEEFNRHLQRLREAKPRVLVGKVLGPVGTAASMGKKGYDVSRKCMERLGLQSELATGQLVARDRYVELLQIIAGISVTLDKIGTEIRNLQRPEINEVMEYFDSEKQVGSSAMPSKRNPIESENVCSLSRLIRAMVVPETESAVTWHERDLTNSALERFTIPYSCILIDYILVKMNRILKNLRVNVDVMKRNLQSSPLCISERLTSELTLKGVDRQSSHEIVRKISMEYYEKGGTLMDIIKKTEFGKIFKENELEEILNPENFTGSAEYMCQNVVKNTLEMRGKLND